MTPLHFKQANRIHNTPGMPPTPIYSDGVQIISKWRLSFWEAVKVLFSQEIWIHTKGTEQPAIKIETYDTPFGRQGVKQVSPQLKAIYNPPVAMTKVLSDKKLNTKRRQGIPPEPPPPPPNVDVNLFTRP